jgi:hypothetical protein
LPEIDISDSGKTLTRGEEHLWRLVDGDNLFDIWSD